jgi:hypothetical protein
VQGEGGEEGKGSDAENARHRALDMAGRGTERADEHWFFPLAQSACGWLIGGGARIVKGIFRF